MAERRLAFGLRIRSELALPELAIDPGDGDVDVEVRLADVPPHLAGARRVRRHGLATPDAFRFEAPGVAAYLAREGREILVAPCVGAAPAHVRTYLLGSVTGALCFQRGMIPLHANALERDGRCIALAGVSGAGKSTLAAQLARRGWRVMGDDICALGFGPDGRAMAWQGARRLKLWADALAAIGETTAGLERVADGRDKYALPHGAERDAGPAPLSRVYLLDRAEPLSEPVRQLAGAAAFKALVDNIYRLEIGLAMGCRDAVFGRVIEALRRVSVFSFARPGGLDRLEQAAAALERHALSGP